MTKYAFCIPGAFPSLNDWLKKDRQAVAQDKAQGEERVLSAIDGETVKPPMFRNRVQVTITAYEPNHMRDWDNVFSVIDKIVLDALERAEIIRRDSQRYVLPTIHIGEIDPANPRIEVEVESIPLSESETWEAIYEDEGGLGYYLRQSEEDLYLDAIQDERLVRYLEQEDADLEAEMEAAEMETLEQEAAEMEALEQEAADIALCEEDYFEDVVRREWLENCRRHGDAMMEERLLLAYLPEDDPFD